MAARFTLFYLYNSTLWSAGLEMRRTAEAELFTHEQTYEEILDEQRNSSTPYDERAMRGVIWQLSQSFSPVALAILNSASSDQEARGLLSITAQKIEELMPPPPATPRRQFD